MNEAVAMTKRRIRVAVVGTGAWWGREHARVWSGRDDAELCAVVGRTEQKTTAMAGAFGVAGYTDLQLMLDQEAPDLVSLSLPNEGHFEPTLQVIESGFPLLVEKPLVFDLGEADALLDAARERDLFFAINFNHRYARPVQMAARAISEGQLGEVVFATWRFGGETGTSSHLHANLIETQCHGFDMLEHLCGPITSVAARMTDMTGRGYSTVAVALGFAAGGVGSLVGSYDSSYAYPGTHLLEVNGTQGRLLVEDTVARFTLSRVGQETRQVWEAGYFNDGDRAFHAMFGRHLDELVPAFRSGGQPPVHARAGRRALELAHAVIESFQTDRIVHLD
jgi:myo-inositol 2-dehydrogenase/D-chiro-inositol 1-dehydrogenase